MLNYLMSALPFLRLKCVTKLEIEGNHFTDSQKNRISDAIRNHLAFLICDQDAERKGNRNTSIFFVLCLFLSTMFLYFLGKKVNVAIHEFILVTFSFFADYLLEFIFLSRPEIKTRKITLEKLANMEIIFKEKSSTKNEE